MITLTQLAGSDEPVQFAIDAITAAGASYDPSSLPVAVAFAPVTSPATPFNPDTATWNTASWSVQPGNPAPVYWITIDPGPGGVAVAAGSYTAYVKITTNAPRGVILPAAYTIFT